MDRSSTIKFILFLFLSISLAQAVHSEERYFSRYEFNYSLLNAGFVPGDSAETIQAKVKSAFPFLKFKPGVARYSLVFLDTPSRELKQHNLILRVRADVDRPEKSIITLKSRSQDVDFVTAFDPRIFDKTKWEIDVSRSKKVYSISHSTYFNYGVDIQPVEMVSAANVLAMIQQKSPLFLGILQQYVNVSNLVSPGFADRLKFKVSYLGQKLELEVWVIDGTDFLTSLSFKGEAVSYDELAAKFVEIYESLDSKGLIHPEQISKTEAYFNHWPAW